MLTSVLLMHTALACIVQLVGIGSAVMFLLSSVPLLLALVFNHYVVGGPRGMWLGTYVLGQLSPLLFGTEIFVAIADIFVPLVRARAPLRSIWY